MANSECEARPMITVGRYRNFRFSCPFDLYNENISRFEDFSKNKCKFFYLQEEMSINGFHHVEVFCKTLTSMSCKYINTFLNIQHCWGVTVSEVEREFDYSRKADTRVENGIVFQYGIPPKTLANCKDVYRELLNCSSVEEGLDYLKEKDPMTYVLRRQAVESCLLRETRKRVVPEYNTNWRIPLVDVFDDKAHIFVGTTGIGKTNFALSHFENPVLISDRQDFGKINAATDGIVIDDMTFKSWLATNVLHIVDCGLERSINVKYGTAVIPAHLPRIITVNDMALFWPADMLPKTFEAIKRRVSVHDFGNISIYDLPAKKCKVSFDVTAPVLSPVCNIIHDPYACDSDFESEPPNLEFNQDSVHIVDYALSPVEFFEIVDLNLIAVPDIVPDVIPAKLETINVMPQSPVKYVRRFGVDMDDSIDDYRLDETLQGSITPPSDPPISPSWSPLSLPYDFFVGIDGGVAAQ